MRGGCEYCGRFRLEQARGSGRVERCDIDAAMSGTALTVVQEVTAIWQELRKAVPDLFGLDADSFYSSVGEEADGLVVRRPERICRAFGARHRLRNRSLQVTKTQAPP